MTFCTNMAYASYFLNNYLLLKFLLFIVFICDCVTASGYLCIRTSVSNMEYIRVYTSVIPGGIEGCYY